MRVTFGSGYKGAAAVVQYGLQPDALTQQVNAVTFTYTAADLCGESTFSW